MDKIVEKSEEIAEYLVQSGWKELSRKDASVKRVFQNTDNDDHIFQVTIPMDTSLADYERTMDEARKVISNFEGREYPPRIMSPFEMNRRLAMCKECMSSLCVFAKNEYGYCLFPLVSGRPPRMEEDMGCLDSACEPDDGFACPLPQQ